MNIRSSERPARVFSSASLNDSASDHAKFFAYPVQTDSTAQSRREVAYLPGADAATAGEPLDAALDGRLGMAENGLWLSPHLAPQGERFDQVWAIYTASFADSERRSLGEQLEAMKQPHYRFSAILHGSDVVGVLAYWELTGFCFVEHFAISSAHRSGGFGHRVMALLQKHVQRPIVLDVAPFGSDQTAARRVAFYQRLGFHYCGVSVELPAYAGKPVEASNLMAWPQALDRVDREVVLATIEREIYGVPTTRVPRHTAV